MQTTFTTTMTSKGQFTVPKPIRDRIKARAGTKFDVQLASNGFVAQPKRKSQFLKFAGNLAHLDDGRPLSEIKEEAHRLGAAEYIRALGWAKGEK